jgi:hypothetical protein
VTVPQSCLADQGSNLQGYAARQAPQPIRRRPFRLERLALWALIFNCCFASSWAALQFDVFLGYDSTVPEASWFPVVFEIKNDGPTFTGTVQLQGGQFNQDQDVRTTLELPTGTLKRLVLPMFSNARGYATWDARLLDEHGRVRAEQTGLRARRQMPQGMPLVAALPRTAGGTPTLRLSSSSNPDSTPGAARLQPSIFPDNPLVLEGMDCLYLNSERAAELSVTQVNAILAWLYAGGHLIIGVEQPSDVNSSPWLRSTFPCEVKDLQTIAHHSEFQDWLRNSPWPNTPARPIRHQNNPYAKTRPAPVVNAEQNNPFSDLPNDADFESKEMQVAVGRTHDGRVELGSDELPLVVTAQRGQGRLTALLFSPEREPLRSWKNLDVFWAKLVEVPAMRYISKDFNLQGGGWSSDGIFGAMIDTRQVHKLPVGWLLLLLLVYLVVIGPLDQFWLKRIGRPMLTWITFPCYVVLFSLVIYFIGYKLRAGESEWNELHVVDAFWNGQHAEWRGRTYASVYSPANERYVLHSHQQYATLRPEFAGLWNGSQASEKATVVQEGDVFKAEIFVPVWTSELFVSDWWQPGSMPLSLEVQRQGEGWRVRVENLSAQTLTNLQLVIEDRIFSLGQLAQNQATTNTLTRDQGTGLRSFVSSYGSDFQARVMSHQRALGSTERGQITDKPNSSIAISFLSQLSESQPGFPQGYQNQFVSPPGLDLSSVVQHGHAVLLAWAADFSPVTPMRQFKPRRSQADTLWRLTVPVE